MAHGVYLESSVIDLQPRVLDFLSTLVERAQEVKDYILTLTKKELADLTGRDPKTASKYLKELEENEVLQSRGRRGRAGGTVVMFNTDIVRFSTSDTALINSDEPISIEDVVKTRYPKAPKKPKKEKTRNRRTKKEMLEAALLEDKAIQKINQRNDELEAMGGIPTWEWFKTLENPVDDYRTYLLSRLYNRYAILFTDYHNAEVSVKKEGNKVTRITNDYDVLPIRFYGTPRWEQFQKIRTFCDDNGIDVFVYLSAQFNRSVFTSAAKATKNPLPFVNTLLTDAAYEAYQGYGNYQKTFSHTYAAYQVIPSRFMDDFVVSAITDAYENPYEIGMLKYRHSLRDMLEGVGTTEKEEVLLDFLYHTDKQLRDKNVSQKTRNTIKKYILTQTLTQSGGVQGAPAYLVIGTELVRSILHSFSLESVEKRKQLRARVLGALSHPNSSHDVQMEKGHQYLYQWNVSEETPHVLRLIMQQKGLHLSIADLNEAIREFGKENLPVDDFSLLDIPQVLQVLASSEEVKETPPVIDHASTVDQGDDNGWVLMGEVSDNFASFEDALASHLNS